MNQIFDEMAFLLLRCGASHKHWTVQAWINASGRGRVRNDLSEAAIGSRALVSANAAAVAAAKADAATAADAAAAAAIVKAAESAAALSAAQAEAAAAGVLSLATGRPLCAVCNLDLSHLCKMGRKLQCI